MNTDIGQRVFEKWADRLKGPGLYGDTFEVLREVVREEFATSTRELRDLLEEALPEIYNDYGPNNPGNTALIERIKAVLAEARGGSVARK